MSGHDKAVAILTLIKPLKRLDKSVGVGNLAKHMGVSLEDFERAVEETSHPREGPHLYFGLKSLTAAIQQHERHELDVQIEQQTQELAELLKRAGKSLKDIHKPRQVKAPKTTGKLSFRLTEFEAPALAHALSLTGKQTVSAQVKACVESYPRIHAMEKSYQAMQKELHELRDSVNALPSLILKLATK